MKPESLLQCFMLINNDVHPFPATFPYILYQRNVLLAQSMVLGFPAGTGGNAASLVQLLLLF